MLYTSRIFVRSRLFKLDDLYETLINNCLKKKKSGHTRCVFVISIQRQAWYTHIHTVLFCKELRILYWLKRKVCDFVIICNKPRQYCCCFLVLIVSSPVKSKIQNSKLVCPVVFLVSFFSTCIISITIGYLNFFYCWFNEVYFRRMQSNVFY